MWLTTPEAEVADSATREFVYSIFTWLRPHPHHVLRWVASYYKRDRTRDELSLLMTAPVVC